MQRVASTLAGIAAVLLALWVVVRDFHPPRPTGPTAADAQADDGGGLLFALGDAGPPPAAAATDDAGSTLSLLGDLPQVDPLEARMRGGPGSLLADGTPVPPLPLTSPRVVRFGVVLVSYTGAQPSAGGGRPATRSRADALALATKLSQSAKDDFHAAVQQGDSGSADDLGTIKLGLLEPAPEYVLFTLPVGGVGGPVDTPRGYWVVKRLE